MGLSLREKGQTRVYIGQLLILLLATDATPLTQNLGILDQVFQHVKDGTLYSPPASEAQGSALPLSMMFTINDVTAMDVLKLEYASVNPNHPLFGVPIDMSAYIGAVKASNSLKLWPYPDKPLKVPYADGGAGREFVIQSNAMMPDYKYCTLKDDNEETFLSFNNIHLLATLPEGITQTMLTLVARTDPNASYQGTEYSPILTSIRVGNTVVAGILMSA